MTALPASRRTGPARRSAAEPTYLALADEVAGRIRRRPAGAAVESENELAVAYGVNRLTARAALDELERRYLVRRRQGRGTFVARRIDYRLGDHVPPSYSATVRLGGGLPSTETERLRQGRPPAAVRDELDLRAGERALVLQRRRRLDGEVAGWAETWLVADILPDLGAELSTAGSLHETLGRLGLEPRRAYARAAVEVASAQVAARLEQAGRPIVYAVTGLTVSARQRRPVELTRSWLRADLFRIVVEVGVAA